MVKHIHTLENFTKEQHLLHSSRMSSQKLCSALIIFCTWGGVSFPRCTMKIALCEPLKPLGSFPMNIHETPRRHPFPELVPLWIFKWREVIVTPNKRPPGMNMHERKGPLCASMEIQHLSSRNHLEPLVAQCRTHPLIKQKASHRSFSINYCISYNFLLLQVNTRVNCCLVLFF